MTNFEVSSKGVITFQGRLCVPDVDNLRKEILTEAHSMPYSVHQGTTKMYKDVKMHYWWLGMKTNVVRYVEQCLTCRQVKADIKGLQVIYSLWMYHSGNGKILLWIL